MSGIIDLPRWITLAPVRKRSGKEFGLDVANLWSDSKKVRIQTPREALRANPAGEIAVGVTPDLSTHTKVNMALINLEASLGDVAIMTNKGSAIYSDDGVSTYFTYFLSGRPVGCMAVTRIEIYPYIASIVSNPAVSQCAGCMFEYLLSYLGQIRAPVKISLKPQWSSLKPLYEVLGFVNAKDKLEPEEMVLYPDKSVVWKNVNGMWRLAKYEHFGYAS
jgi:hypothetical protein